MSTKIKTVAVVGGGVIGSSWAGLFCAKGFRVLVSCRSRSSEERVSDYVDNIWPTLEGLGLAPGASRSNITFVGPSLENYFSEVDFIQENVPEKLEVKQKVIADLDAGARDHVVIASSSSGIPSSQFIQQCSKNTGRVLVCHPINPPHLMPLVEVVPHPACNEDAVSTAMDLYRALGKQPIVIKREIPGFVANRLQAALCQEAYSLVQRGIVSASELDICMTNSMGPRWALVGPFMSAVLGGGGGTNGFRHLMEHIGPGTQLWLKDMRENEYCYTAENFEMLNAGVQELLKAKDSTIVAKQRDEMMVKLLNVKKDY